VVDITHHNTNRSVLVEGPMAAIRPVAKRQVKGCDLQRGEQWAFPI
jgi:hypothetical protein